MPKIAVISVGKNDWGFPRPEILSLLAKYNVKVYRTDQMVNPPASAMLKALRAGVEVVTDGEKYWIK
jgi:beta-lactamase superfamily II metal-dependent hydrolase